MVVTITKFVIQRDDGMFMSKLDLLYIFDIDKAGFFSTIKSARQSVTRGETVKKVEITFRYKE